MFVAVRREPHQIKQNGNTLAQFCRRHAIKPTVQSEKLCRGEPIVETEMFGKKTNFAACLDVADRAAKKLGFAARGKYQTQQHFHRRTFTGAIWSQETEN